MANGPLGGFMPTPAAPAQPPSVKVETTADSRGTFSNFLKNMNGATSLNPPSMAPEMGAKDIMAPAANIDIFNQPQNFLSGGLVQFGQDLERGLGEPVRQKIREIPQFLQVVEDSAKERFGVDLGGSNSFTGNTISNRVGPGFGQPIGSFNPVQQPIFAFNNFQDFPIPKQELRANEEGKTLNVDNEFIQPGAGSPFETDMQLRDQFGFGFQSGVMGGSSNAFGGGNIRNQGMLSGIGAIQNMFQPQFMFDGGEVDDFGDPGISFDTSDPSIGDSDISLSSDEIASGTFDDGDSGVTFDDDLAAQPGIVAPGISAPKEFEPMFPNPGIKIGNFTIPSIFSLGNYVSNLSRGRVLDSIAEKGYTPVYGGKNNDVVVGARDPKTGILMEGMDPNEMLDSDDNNTDPIIKNTIKPIVEEEKDDDKPPNVIGGEEPKPIVPTDTSSVVASPFAPATSSIDPVSFDAGELNKLIEMLTGVPAKPIVSKQEGGLVSAVDEFLASAA